MQKLSLEQLRRIAIWGPLAFLLLLEVGRRFLLERFLNPLWAAVLFFALAGSGIFLFSRWVFGLIQTARRREQAALLAAQRRYAQLEGLRQAGLALTAELDLESVLQKVVDLSREVVDCRYGALGVLADDGQFFDRFIVSGLSAAAQKKIGRPPTGLGVLGTIITHGEPLRLADLTAHPDSIGFPPHHPPMKSFLGVPVIYQENMLGHLYLTEKRGGQFTEQDEAIAGQFARQAAVAITNARLYSQVEHLAVMEERERIGMDLHDGTIQSLYALGLMLEDLAEQPDLLPPPAADAMYRAVDTLGRIIGDIRHYIFDLKLPATPGETVREQINQLLDALQLENSLAVKWEWDAEVEPLLADRQMRSNLLHIFREALSNIAQYAQAENLTIAARRQKGGILLTLRDDGRGFTLQQAAVRGGRGLGNMKNRAEALGGRLEITSAPAEGTTVSLHLPDKILQPTGG